MLIPAKVWALSGKENGCWKFGRACGNAAGFSPPRPPQPSWALLITIQQSLENPAYPPRAQQRPRRTLEETPQRPLRTLWEADPLGWWPSGTLKKNKAERAKPLQTENGSCESNLHDPDWTLADTRVAGAEVAHWKRCDLRSAILSTKVWLPLTQKLKRSEKQCDFRIKKTLRITKMTAKVKFVVK